MKNLSDNLRGALFMVISMTAFTLNDACMKGLSDDLPLFQALFLRGLGTTTILILISWYFGHLRFNLARRDWGLIALRTAAEAMAAWFFITALYNMPLANVSAILQSLPLAVTLASALFLKEAVGWRRFMAIFVGFIGVLLIVQPGSEGFTHYSVFALLSVAGVVVRDLSARRMSREVPSVLIALAAAFGVTIFAGLGSLTVDWQSISAESGWQLAGAMTFVVGGYVASVAAMRTGEIGFVAPFRYASLLVALVVGFVAFGDWPDQITLTGAAIVVATGLFTLYRERMMRRAAARVARAARE